MDTTYIRLCPIMPGLKTISPNQTFMALSRFLTFEAFGVSSPFDPTFHYVTSPVFPSVVLGALRLLFATYGLITVIITLALYQDLDASVTVMDLDAGQLTHPFYHRYLSYFTILSYIGLVAYLWASGVQTIAFVLRGRKSYPLQTWPRFLQFLHVLLHSAAIVFRAFFPSLLTPVTSLDSEQTVSHHCHGNVLVCFRIVGNV